MESFSGKLAVITGASTGMGRELALQLSSQGCHVAICDVVEDAMETTRADCEAGAPAGTRVSAHPCDVSKEDQMLAFRDGVAKAHETDHVDLVFNNAGIGGGGSFINDSREEWDRVFGVCWSGVYFGSRAFMPMLLKSKAGHLVNISSVNGFWASLGPDTAHTAYSAAKFAVKGFSEALLNDLRLHAPHVKVSVVMPGHIGTDIAINSFKLNNRPEPADLTDEDLAPMRERMRRAGLPADLPADALRQGIQQQVTAFRDNAPVTAGQAATVILQGVAEGRWRILVGDDARFLDETVRANPEGAYERDFFQGADLGMLNSRTDKS